MSASIDIEELNTLLEPYIVALKDFEQLDNTPFRLNAFNGVYAPAKSGKTHFVLEQLNSLNVEVYKTIWLDGDRNAELKGKFENIHHNPIGNATEAFKALVSEETRYDNYIFIIDSFKDFNFGADTDTNRGCQSVMMEYQKLLDLGATIVVIFHSTKTNDGKGHYDFKLKGNADTIESKMDFLYKLHRTKDDFVNLTVACSREAGLRVGDELSFGNKEVIVSRVRALVKAEPEISLRDLKRKDGLSAYASMVDELEGVAYETIRVPTDGGGRPKTGLKLI